jgi:hypothetical protein
MYPLFLYKEGNRRSFNSLVSHFLEELEKINQGYITPATRKGAPIFFSSILQETNQGMVLGFVFSIVPVASRA